MNERFGGALQLDGLNPYVEVPEDVLGRLGGATPLHVLVKVGALPQDGSGGSPVAFDPSPSDAARLRSIGHLTADGWFRCTVLGRGGVPARLYLDPWVKDGAGVSQGGFVMIALRPDLDPRELELPDRLRQGLASSPGARSAWEAMTESRQKEILNFLSRLKTPAALEQNVDQLLTSLVLGVHSEAREP